MTCELKCSNQLLPKLNKWELRIHLKFQTKYSMRYIFNFIFRYSLSNYVIIPKLNLILIIKWNCLFLILYPIEWSINSHHLLRPKEANIPVKIIRILRNFENSRMSRIVRYWYLFVLAIAANPLYDLRWSDGT